jgi:capsular polysaccharide biosynthesis protein
MTKYLKIFPLGYYIYRQFRLEKFKKTFLLKRILSEFFFNLKYDKFSIKKFHWNNAKFANTINYSKCLKKNLQSNRKKKISIKNYKYSFRFSKIKNVRIYSSNFAVVSSYVLYFSNWNFFKEVFAEELNHLFYPITTKLIGIHKTTTHKLDKVIHLTCSSSTNYAHFMLEVVPRLIWFSKQKRYKNYFFVLNEYRHINYQEIINLSGVKKLFFLKTFETVLAKEAIVSNPATEIIFNPRFLHYSNQFRHDGMFNFKLIDFASREILKRLKIKHSNKYKIYIKRNSSFRKINDSKLESYFKNKGYTIIDCSQISFEKQVYYFSNAGKVVLQNGSETANAMFCNSATKFLLISFYSEYTMTNFWISYLVRKFKTSVYFQKINLTKVFLEEDIKLNENDFFNSLNAFNFE